MTLLITLPDSPLVERLGSPPADTDYLIWDMQSAPPTARPIGLAVMPYMAPASTLRVVGDRAVTAVQSLSLGYDGVAEVLRSDVVFCNAKGVHEKATAEHALALILSAQRELGEFARAQTEPSPPWDQRFTPGLEGATVMIVGAGGVGAELDRMLRALGLQTIRVARTARRDADGDVHPTSALRELAALADIVVLAVPLDATTRHLVDAAFLAACRPGTLIVNVARGPVVDTAALTESVRSGLIRATLDVTDPEPLPGGHPLWRLPGVTITPHVAGRTHRMWDRAAALILDQADRLRQGLPLRNRIALHPIDASHGSAASPGEFET
ncbi:NAD(P)-dependent oxidoreductase [Gryllotalpicola ginsengisoli]|uniref:NAD(P)-dependent oxidoreductase n=1 Tax=Gryllotalpicola ginsengisoli TaxID=444608 RepID=UPI0003B53910|nr:NAD(P)-dependent oxidoreductase [Gryllotalpicola ginsengisoli]